MAAKRKKTSLGFSRPMPPPAPAMPPGGPPMGGGMPPQMKKGGTIKGKGKGKGKK